MARFGTVSDKTYRQNNLEYRMNILRISESIRFRKLEEERRGRGQVKGSEEKEMADGMSRETGREEEGEVGGASVKKKREVREMYKRKYMGKYRRSIRV